MNSVFECCVRLQFTWLFPACSVCLCVCSQTEVISPGKSMKLSCEGWYTLVCKRLQDGESREQDVPFTFQLALNQGFFHDGYLKSSEGHQVW